jgi:predicted enzyme related to lactoylglutathione lyase
MIKDVAFIGYPTTDMKKARAFYEGILGLAPSEEFPVTDESEFVEYNIGSSTLSLGKMDGWKPSKDGPCIAFEVEQIDEAIQKLKDNNVEFFMEKTDFPNCSMAIVRDPDGNQVVIHKHV